MKTSLTFVLLILITINSLGQEWNDKYGSPIVVLTETNPWLMVIGSDVPTIVLYQYGDIIYKRRTKSSFEYYSNKIDTAEMQKLILSLGITDSLIKMPEYISATQTTDQPTNELILSFDSVYVKRVYGNLRETEKPSQVRENAPKYFLKVYDNLLDLTKKRSKKWFPDYVEVMLTDYSYSPEIPLKWPETWPGLSSKMTVKRGDDLYSIYLKKENYDDLIKLIKSLKEKQAIEIDGEKFSISYRFPYPNIR
jgi:hypothetical protein